MWVRGLGLGFTNSVGTGGVWDMCLCMGSMSKSKVLASLEPGTLDLETETLTTKLREINIGETS